MNEAIPVRCSVCKEHCSVTEYRYGHDDVRCAKHANRHKDPFNPLWVDRSQVAIQHRNGSARLIF